MVHEEPWQAFRDADRARQLIARIRRRAESFPRLPVVLMEVCGTHTVAISRSGIRSALQGRVKLVSGPGCPVCVTSAGDVDAMVALAGAGPTVFTFGDMMRVPGSTGSLEQVRSQGAKVKIAYSPLDAVSYAQQHPTEEVVFLAVGFETTAPAVALALAHAHDLGLANFSIYPAHKTLPPALRALLGQGTSGIQGFLLPGHVCTIIGRQAVDFLGEEFGVAAVIAGFEPVDILLGVDRLLELLGRGEAAVENLYSRAVREEGNPHARAAYERFFRPGPAVWRGLGLIASSGLELRPEWEKFDARKRFSLPPVSTGYGAEVAGACRCGEVLRGRIGPDECPLFGRACTPGRPQGPCMVSSEGACAAYYRYGSGTARGLNPEAAAAAYTRATQARAPRARQVGDNAGRW